MIAKASTYCYRGLLSSVVRKSGERYISDLIKTLAATPFEEDDIPRELLLHALHVVNKAQFTSFKGFKMPWIYAGKPFENQVLFTRREASVFDASYRPQIYLRGKDISKIMETMTTSDLQEMKPDEAVLTLMTNPQGGIIDDLVVTKLNENELHIVANTPKALEEIKKKTQGFKNDVQMTIPKDMTLLTFQGPECSKLLQLLIMDNVRCLPFMHSLQGESVFWNAIPRLTRCSDTGEDGFMLSLPASHAEEFLFYAISNNSRDLQLIGLQSREALRIEAGLCLSGVDYNEKTTPVQARLQGLIGKRRRFEGKFPGADIILKEMINASNSTVRVGFVSTGSCKAGASIEGPNGNVIGKVTSASFSPCLQQHIGIGYVETEFAQIGKELLFDKNVKGIIAQFPFVRKRTYTNVDLF